jgi:signal transduction histidine kinase
MSRPVNFFVSVGVLLAGGFFAAAQSPVTNVAGLNLVKTTGNKIYRDVRIEAVVCSVSPSGRELVLTDGSCAEVVRIEARAKINAGEKILLAGSHCWVRPESWGISLGVEPLIDNEVLLNSAGRAQPFLGNQQPEISVLSSNEPPVPQILKPGAAGAESRWAEVSGTVQQVIERDQDVEILLNSQNNPVRVRLAGRVATPAFRPDSRVIVHGVARDAFRADGSRGFGILEVASIGDLHVQPPESGDRSGVLTAAADVEMLSHDQAGRGYPAKIRGVVTCDTPELFFGSVIQDQTRGIYVYWSATNLETGGIQRRPRFGEFWEVEGLSQPGKFAPDIEATRMNYLGEGELPSPVSPNWDQLLNGSLDTQFIELQGIITGANTNSVELLTHGGKIRVDLAPSLIAELRRKPVSLVRLRGCLLAVWDESSRQVKLGEIRLGNATAIFDSREPSDPFDAPQKDVDDLRRFDMAAGSFQRVKITGQVMEKRGDEFFMIAGGRGLRFVPREAMAYRPGDIVEAVGFPEIGGPSPVLHEAVARPIGSALLPAPVWLRAEEFSRPQNDAQRVRLEAVLNDMRGAAEETLLDLQAGGYFFTARLRLSASVMARIEPGSRVELTGVFAALSAPNQRPGLQQGSFELLVSSPKDVRVVARPPWWTLRRLLALIGTLIMVLILAAVWITQLRRRVEERTKQLQHEIGQREHAEQLRIVQEERTRIAQDLHDDLGSSLTEISVLASVGLRSHEIIPATRGLFEAVNEKSRHLVSALDAIVWAIDPKENTLQSLVDYLAGYVENYLATTGITVRFKLPSEVPLATLEGKQRHEVFLVVKEALHNIVRHAHASEVQFEMTVVESGLGIGLSDNGRGFDTSLTSGGYGLKNFAKRMAQLGGECIVTSRTGGGTVVKLHLPLSKESERATASG